MASTSSTATLIINALAKQGINNTYVQAGIVGKVGQETGYVPKAEYSYKNTPNANLRQIFGSRIAKYSDAQLTALKANDVAFFDAIYGGQYGNTSAGDGYKYRGRGFNQITFKSAYQKYGSAIGVDLVSNPDLLNDPATAAAACAVYFADTFKTAKANGTLKSKLGINDLSEIKDFDNGAKAAVQANAGFATDTTTPFFQNVYAEVMSNINSLYDTLKHNPGKTLGGIAAAAAIFFLGYQLFKTN
jgi:predicted chitinase